MSATLSTSRLSRVALLAVTGATALSLAACGSSNETKPNPATPSGSAPTSSTPSAGKAKDWVKGLIDSVSGSTIQVSAKSGPATVDFTPSTMVSEITPAQLTDVTAGSCVSVFPDHHGGAPEGGAITARAVRVSAAVDGKCPAAAHPAGESAQHRQPPPRGQVASVAGNSITLNGTDAQGNPSQTTVNVTDTTQYTKQTTADSHALVQGKCIAAHGTKDSGGALQATTISVQPADNGSCPEPGGKHHQR